MLSTNSEYNLIFVVQERQLLHHLLGATYCGFSSPTITNSINTRNFFQRVNCSFIQSSPQTTDWMKEQFTLWKKRDVVIIHLGANDLNKLFRSYLPKLVVYYALWRGRSRNLTGALATDFGAHVKKFFRQLWVERWGLKGPETQERPRQVIILRPPFVKKGPLGKFPDQLAALLMAFAGDIYEDAAREVLQELGYLEGEHVSSRAEVSSMPMAVEVDGRDVEEGGVVRPLPRPSSFPALEGIGGGVGPGEPFVHFLDVPMMRARNWVLLGGDLKKAQALFGGAFRPLSTDQTHMNALGCRWMGRWMARVIARARSGDFRGLNRVSAGDRDELIDGDQESPFLGSVSEQQLPEMTDFEALMLPSWDARKIRENSSARIGMERHLDRHFLHARL